MNSTASNAWMPTGRHEISLGSSFMRALKARKGGPVKNNSKAKPDREFYSFRYNFKPESVDPTKPGSIEIKDAKEDGTSSVHVVRPSTQNEHGVNYAGQSRASKPVDCVLIFDEELQTLTLEKIEDIVTLQHDPRTVHAPRYANSPAPPAPQRPSATPAREAIRQEEEESEGEILEPAKPKLPSRLTAAAVQPKGKPTTAPAAQPASRSLPPSLPPKPVTPTIPPKPTPAAVPAKPVQTVPPPRPRPRPIGASTLQATAKGPNKRELPADADETPAVRRPVQPPPLKKAKVVPEKKKEPVALALPGSSASPALALPSASSVSTSAQPPSLSLPTSSSFVTLPPAPKPPTPAPTIPAPEPAVAAVTDSDEEEWDEVQPTITPAASAFAPAPAPVHAGAPPVIVMEEIEPSAFTPPVSRADGDDGEGDPLDIDMAAFEEELMEQLADPEADADVDADAEVDAEGDADADEDDFLAGAMSPVVERQPVSLSAYAGGGPDFGDEDDFSSSDSSDED